MSFRPLQAETIEQQPSGFRSLETDWQMSKEISNVEGQKSGILQKTGEITGGLFKGFGKGVISTGVELSSLMEKGIRVLLPKAAEEFLDLTDTTIAEEIVPEELREPEGGWERAGFTAEKIAEFLLPSGKIAALKGLATMKIGELGLSTGAGRALEIATKGMIEAGTTGGITTIQEGKFDNTAKITTIIGGIFGVGGAILGKALPAIGQKIQQTVIRPIAKDIKDGFKIENINKYKVGGTLPETATKVHVEINKRVSELNNILKTSKQKININQVFDETMDELSKQKYSNFGDLIPIKKVAETLKKEMNEIIPMLQKQKERLVNLTEATNIKRGAGTKGSWAFGRFEPDSKATETVYNVFYNKLKTAIEKGAEISGGRVKQLNKEISELIPISHAIIRRLPVEQRNNVIGLTDSIGLFASMFDPKALLLLGASKLSRSGRFGEFLSGLSDFGNKMRLRGIIGTYPFLEK